MIILQPAASSRRQPGSHLIHHQPFQLCHLATHALKGAQRLRQPAPQRLHLRLQLGHAAVQRCGTGARQIVHLVAERADQGGNENG